MFPRFKSDLRRVLCFLAAAAPLTSVPARASDSVTLTPIAVEGQQAPGVESGWVYSFLDGVELNQSGQILVSSDLRGPTIDPYWYARGTWTGSPPSLSLVGYRGYPAPVTGGAFATLTHDGIDDAGRLLVSGSTLEGLKARWYGVAGQLAPVAVSGQQAPGLHAGVNHGGTSTGALSRNGHMAFGGAVVGTGIDGTNNNALWSGTAGSLTLIARSGAPAPGAGDGVTFSRITSAAAYNDGPVINNKGQTLFVATIGGPTVDFWDNERLYFADAGQLKLIGPVPHAAIYGTLHYGNPALNDAGQFALRTFQTTPAFFPRPEGPPTNYNIWTGTADGGLTLVAGRDKPLPGGIGAPRTASEPLLNSAGQLLFAAGNDTMSALFRGTNDDLDAVARWSAHAPGTPAGVLFSNFYPIGFNNRGQFVTHGRVTGPGVDNSNDLGVWASFAGRLELILREGQAIEAGGQVKTVSWVGAPRSGTGEDGRQITFNDLGQFVFEVHFTDGTEAFLLAQLPTTIPGDANLDGIVNSADFQALFAHFGQAGDRAAGDFNGDQVVSFADFQILERNFGRAMENLPPVPAGEIAAFAASAGSVPEPAVGGVVVAGCALLACRRRRPARPIAN